MRHVCVLYALIIVTACSDISETVTYDPKSQTVPGEDLSTLYPTIQTVYPGTLQTLDIPEEYPNDVLPEGACFAVVYSEVMENDDSEMESAFMLFENGTQIAHRLGQDASSRYFTIEPGHGSFGYGNTYELRVYRFAHLDDNQSLYTDFGPLVEPPATSLSPIDPDYVTYAFRTAAQPYDDTQSPVFLAATPGPGDTDVDVLLASTAGSIILTLYDNVNPMIRPDTVNVSTVQLYEIGTGAVPLDVSLDATDLNMKTYELMPLAPLSNAATYRVTVSIGDSIEDIAGNRMDEYVYFFLTEP